MASSKNGQTVMSVRFFMFLVRSYFFVILFIGYVYYEHYENKMNT